MAQAPHTAVGGPGSAACGEGDDLLERLLHASLDCVHCGLCLSSCPTYVETGRETSSPRGRVYLMRGLAEGRIEAGPLLEEEAFLCLDCRACETACPSGVAYGAMVEDAREHVVASGGHTGLAGRLERFAVRAIVPRPARLRALLAPLRLLQRTRLDRALVALLPASLARPLELAPRVPAAAEREALPLDVRAEGERRGRVAFFVGCLMPEVFPQIHRATLRVLVRNGFDVHVPPAQGCCGALQAHAGERATANALARRNVGAFEAAPDDASSAPFDAIVVNSAGCGAALREADRWLGASAAGFAGRVRDVCELLAQVGVRAPEHPLHGRVCYDDPCHLVHAQGVAAAPRELLDAIPGLERVEHDDAGACCGAACVYNLTHPAMSRAVLARKLDAIARVDPDWVATGNPGCLMQIAAGLRERRLRARAVHPIELLDAAYCGAASAATPARDPR